MKDKSMVLHGIPVSPGIVAGRTRVIRKSSRLAEWYHLSRQQIAREIRRFLAGYLPAIYPEEFGDR
ncbi:MAG TPA: hypothetical protein DDY20_01270 [Desulfobulbaceae bacterium]|nr:hypothetical protein [Desulfobulbaceae bacterium]